MLHIKKPSIMSATDILADVNDACQAIDGSSVCSCPTGYTGTPCVG